MGIMKKAAALFMAAAAAISLGVMPFAQETEPVNGDGLIDSAVTAQAEGFTEESGEFAAALRSETETETEEMTPDSGVDLSDSGYTPIDISGYTRWDGKSKMISGVNYYIDDIIKPRKNFTVPENSKLVIKNNAALIIYKGKSLNVKGNIIAEPESVFTVSGTMTLYRGAGIENYGNLSATLSSLIKIAGEFIVRKDSRAVFSGTVNVYSGGIYLNYGSTNLTESALMKVTGDVQTPENGRFYCGGSMSITVNGRTTQAGYFLLSGKLVNSGMFILENTVSYFKSPESSFAVSKNSRLIDYRFMNPQTPSESGETSVPEENTPAAPEGNDASEVTDVGFKGIDVSYVQGNIDWTEVKKHGVNFAMIRASRGYISSEKPEAEDAYFSRNIEGAVNNGINVGVYHYLYASTVSQAKKEAEFFIKTIDKYKGKITYPVVLDVEEDYQAKLGKKALTEIVRAFLDEIKAAGYYPMLFSYKFWLTDHLDMSKLSEYDVWLGQWNAEPTYSGNFGIWQYSDMGIIGGIKGYVDLDISYKDYAKIIREGNYNKLT